MPTTQQRLQKICRDGNLTVSDLARWFRVPHPTVRTWVKNGTEPRMAPQDSAHFMALLNLMETLIKKQKYLPVPQMSARKRIAYIENIRARLLPASTT